MIDLPLPLKEDLIDLTSGLPRQVREEIEFIVENIL
jgi:hypothetical protein